MNISQRSVPPRSTAALAVGLMALPAAMAVSHPTASHPAATSHTVTAVRPPRGLGLSISISDGHVAARAGDRLTYTVRVRNSGTEAARQLTITQTLSAGLQFISASDHGARKSGRVSWSAGLPVGGTRTFSVVTRVTETPATLLRLAAVACVALPGSSSPVVCAAHLDRLPAAAGEAAPASGRPGLGVLTYAAAGFVVLALGLVIAIVARRRSRRGRLRRQPA